MKFAEHAKALGLVRAGVAKYIFLPQGDLIQDLRDLVFLIAKRVAELITKHRSCIVLYKKSGGVAEI